MSITLRDLIDDNRVHVVDGAMGTVLYGKGMFVNVCYDELTVTKPDLVQGVHEEYRRAGAEILETNTFGANPVKLSSHGLEERTEEINRAAAALARDVAGARASVVGAVGPLGIRIEPWGPTGKDEAEEFYRRQVRGLLEGGVDGFVLETFSDLDELHAAYRAVRGETDLPVIAQMTIDESGKTAYGTDAEHVAAALTEWGADVVGLNCSVGPAVMLDGIEQMAEVTKSPLSAQPNAGLPRTVGDRKIYLSSPEYLTNYAQRLIQVGVRFVGGCCGTTPEHIKRISDMIATTQPRLGSPVVERRAVQAVAEVEATPLAERSRLGAKLAAGEFVTNVELLPPKGWSSDRLLEHARALQASGVDAVSILDGPRAQSRMGAIPTAIVVERDVGIEAVVHYTCRDRNMLGMMSDLLGAAAAGLRNFLIVTGDPPRMGPYPDSTAVFDIDSIGLTNVVYRLNHGLDPGGNSIGAPTQFVIGVALNHAALDTDRELRRLYWKVDAGADYVITQPVFDVDQFAQFLKRTEEYGIPVVAGVWPLVSLRNAEFLANEVPGQQVPPRVIERMRKAQDKGDDAALAEGIAIAREVLDAMRDLVHGAHLSAPLGRIEVAQEVLG